MFIVHWAWAQTSFDLFHFKKEKALGDPSDFRYSEPIHNSLIFYYASLKLSGNRSGNTSLSEALQSIIQNPHIQKAGSPDRIVSQCPAELAPGEVCVRPFTFEYANARRIIFGRLHLQVDRANQYFINDVYCEKKFTASDFPESARNQNRVPGPDLVPDDTIINTEHTWPQHRFNKGLRKDDFNVLTQKSDLHHLFPSDDLLNANRGHFEFAEVVKETDRLKCPQNKIGLTKDPKTGQLTENIYFEPPDSHKGNVARALFYFSVRYRLPINDIERDYLVRWNRLDPVDEFEHRRNENIYKLQGNRNPFVDHPEWIDLL